MTMKFKLSTFEVRSRSQTLPDYTCVTEIISQCASEILRDEMKAELTENSRALTLRLMGDFVSAYHHATFLQSDKLHSPFHLRDLQPLRSFLYP